MIRNRISWKIHHFIGPLSSAKSFWFFPKIQQQSWDSNLRLFDNKPDPGLQVNVLWKNKCISVVTLDQVITKDQRQVLIQISIRFSSVWVRVSADSLIRTTVCLRLINTHCLLLFTTCNTTPPLSQQNQWDETSVWKSDRDKTDEEPSKRKRQNVTHVKLTI